MKLELLSLRAVNCGPLKDVRIDFSDGQGHARPITLLAGANGSGKTTVLELIADLASLLDDGFDPRKSRLAQAEYAQLDLNIGEDNVSLFFGKTPDDQKTSANVYGARTFLELAGVRRNNNLNNPIVTQLKDAIGFASGTAMDYLAPSQRENITTTPPPTIIFFPYVRSLPFVEGDQLSIDLSLNI